MLESIRRQERCSVEVEVFNDAMRSGSVWQRMAADLGCRLSMNVDALVAEEACGVSTSVDGVHARAERLRLVVRLDMHSESCRCCYGELVVLIVWR